jgi:hypothetical protein
MQNEIEIYADTRGVSRCTGATCGRRILWATIAASGKKMCFDDLELVALKTRTEASTNRVIETVDRTVNHWATCPDAKRFKR